MWGASVRAHVHTTFARWCLLARSFVADQSVILVMQNKYSLNKSTSAKKDIGFIMSTSWRSGNLFLPCSWKLRSFVARCFSQRFEKIFLSCTLYPRITLGTYASNILTFALVGGGVILPPPPLWFFEDNSKTKGSSVTKLGIPFH